MKTAKKLASLLLALVMVLSLATTAFATMEGSENGGSITINDAVDGQTYNIYQIMYLESYDATAGTYAYKANSAWADWLATQTDYVSIDAQGYVTWVKDEAGNLADAAAFAKLAQVQARSMTADGTVTANSATVRFENLKLGYYLVDTTLGTLCSLDTTNPDVIMKEKNEAPSNEKFVEEDSNNTWGKKDDADIGQTVNFKSVITAQPGAENYVFHDKMSTGLTSNNDAKVYTDADMTVELAAVNYTVDTNPADADTFDITFTQTYLDTITAETKLYVKYSATLNENAIIAGNGNPNESKLSYGDSSNSKETPKSETITYTWEMDVFKYAEKDGKEIPVSGAHFTLSKNADGTNPIALINKGNNVYRVAKTGEANSVAEVITDATGKFKIEGLDADTYYLTETVAPAGYNKLTGHVTVVIDNEGKVKVDNKEVDEVKVLNQSGTELPSTGGMGTTIFYVLGSILAIGAVVLLVTKKRMSANA